MKTILNILQKEHREVKKHLLKMEKSKASAVRLRKELFKKVTLALESHMLAEEEVLYAPLRDKKNPKDEILEAHEEHHVTQVLLDELNALPVDHERWIAKLTVLRESLDHHVKEEEEDLFSDARKKFAPQMLESMGAKFLLRQKQYMSSLSKRKPQKKLDLLRKGNSGIKPKTQPSALLN